MIRGIAYSKSRAAACASALGALVAAGSMRHHVASARLSWQRLDAGREGALLAEIAGMRAYESPGPEDLRSQVRGFRARLGAPDTWEKLCVSLGKAWKAGAVRREDRDGYAASTGAFMLSAPSTSDWSRIVDAVRATEQVPGVGVVGFEMRTSGDREHRTVDLVRIEVSAHTRAAPREAPVR